MGTRLARFRFPDGTTLYGTHHTSSNATGGPLYRDHAEDGYRDRPCGEPVPERPDVPPAPLDRLIRVVLSYDNSDHEWYGLYDPDRCEFLGPASGTWYGHMQDQYDLVRGHDGRRHLVGEDLPVRHRVRSGRTVCGVDLTDAAVLPYHRPDVMLGFSEEEIRQFDEVEDVDLLAEWDEPDLCRACVKIAATRNRGWWS
jgi:hypothetical protein